MDTVSWFRDGLERVYNKGGYVIESDEDLEIVARRNKNLACRRTRNMGIKLGDLKKEFKGSNATEVEIEKAVAGIEDHQLPHHSPAKKKGMVKLVNLITQQIMINRLFDPLRF
jgi:hypothetical protein